MSRKVTIRIGGNLLMLDPTTPRIQGIVAPLLTYTTKIILRGRDRYLAEKEHRPPVYDREYECFNDDHRGRLVAQYGFLDRIVAALEAADYKIRYDEVTPHPDPSVYEPQWERFYANNPGLKFRYKQKALLKMLAAHRNGRIDCPTGYGKSFCIGLAAQLFPRAKIDVLTRTLAVLETRLYPELCSMLPSVGIVSGKRKVLGRRVTCYSFGSLHHAEGDADFVFIDECFPAGTKVDGRPIETIEPGDLVTSATDDGRLVRRPVVRVFRSEPKAMVRVVFADGSSQVCTAGHPYWTREFGFVAAALLTPDCFVLKLKDGGDENRAGELQDLRSSCGVLGATAAVGVPSRPAVLLEGVRTEGAFAAHEVEESDAVGGGCSEVGADASRTGARAVGPRRERPWTDGSGADAGGGDRTAAERGRAAGREGERLSHELQGGFGGAGAAAGGGGGRDLASAAGAAAPGSEEGGEASLLGVARVEVLESTGAGGFGGLCPGGAVYNLEVAETHTYFAEGVLVHNCHQAAADDVAAKWGRYDKARIFGFSASHDMRLDRKDVRVEGLCGPVRLAIPYQKAVEKGIVVPIEVHWTDVIMDVDPCGDAVDAEKKRLGIWANEHRNRLIRRDARRYGDDVQVLIAVATFEHALHLKRLLPEFKLMYNADSIKPSDWVYYKKQHLIPPDFALLTDHRRTAITKRFEAGRIRWVIATPVWNVGVDMRWLQVLVRGDGGGSPINDVQLPGRTSRTNADGKAVGIVHDYRDFFNTGCARNSASREKTYERMGWTQHYPDRANRGALRRLMRWGDAE